MSRLALISAMHEELAAVLARLPVAGREFWVGHWHGHEVVAVLSRIGKVAAATTATTLIERFGVTRMVFTGVAGGLAPHIHVGDVVVAREFIQHDMDASPLFPRHEVPLTGLTRFTADAALSNALAAAAPLALQDMVSSLPRSEWMNLDLAVAQVHQGLIASGDRFVSQTVESQALQRDIPDALAVEMECAAIAQVCQDYGVPLAAVRTISDRADDAAHVDFSKFIQTIASRYSVAVLDRLLSTLPA
jgi:adenosylhomocysteine nucleosidase